MAEFGEFKDLVERFRLLPQTLRKKIVVGATRHSMSLFERQIKQVHLSAPPGPSKDSLHARTGRLRSGVFTIVSTDGDDVLAGLGTEAWYGILHERGGSFTRKAHLRRTIHVFGKGRGKLKTISIQRVKSHKVTFPTRRPFGHGVDEKMPDFRRAFVVDVAKSMDDYLEGRAVLVNS